MGFFTSKKGSIISDYFCVQHDVGTIPSGSAVEVSLYDDHIELSCPAAKTPIKLAYDQITDVFFGYREELVEKSKSVIGRAVAGGLLFGGVGAVVGATSGIGNKTAKHIDKYLVISYKSKDGTDKFLEFKDTRRYRGEKVAKKLKELCHISEQIITEL